MTNSVVSAPSTLTSVPGVETMGDASTTGPAGDASSLALAWGAVGGVLGVLLVVVAVLVVVMVVLVVIYRMRRRKETNTSNGLDCHGMIANNSPTCEGDVSNTSLDPEVGINIYSKLNHPQQQQQQRLPQQDIPSQSYHTLEPSSISLNEETKTQCEWGLFVPTVEERRAFKTAPAENIYAVLSESQYSSIGADSAFFEESASYWSPASDSEELYQQLADKRYREIPKHQIQITDHLGSGQFGTVTKGVWQLSTGTMEVAVKTLKPGASESDAVKFLQEAAINGQFRHPNVVKLLGVVTVEEPVMIVLELLTNGDLRSYLIAQRPAEPKRPFSNPRMLLRFCKDIASGMEYLAGKSFVHRDLAARNILVAKDRVCKISDFGMSRDLEDENYYVSHGTGKIPVKWTAPEALHFKKYSTASDVWSYGAVMYEIWSLGHKPFEGYTNSQALKLVDSGYRLPPPPGCPREIYWLMIQCWHAEKSCRPMFTQLLQALSSPVTDLLRLSEEDTRVHPQSAVLGAPLETSKDVYPELQGTYMHDYS